MGKDVDEALKDAPAPWFRARTCHEYAVVRSAVQDRIDWDHGRILDFGCGELPIAAASFALRHPGATVLGTDILPIDPERLRATLDRESGLSVPANLCVQTVAPSSLPDEADNLDLVYSWSVFEHIPAAELVGCFRLVRERLAKNGFFFFQISPLYHSPFGSHLTRYFPDDPWHHLRLSIEEVRARVSTGAYPGDVSTREMRQFIELNRRAADDFLEAATEAGLTAISKTLGKCAATAPLWLTRTYHRDVLETEEIRVLFKPS